MRLHIKGLDQHYGSAQVLRKVDLTIEPGECFAVLGRNGAGKSTLLKCLMGVIAPTEGSILLDDADITAWPSHRRSQAGLAYVPQGREIFPALTVGENIAVAARAHGREPGSIADEVVAMFPILGDIWGRLGGALSGGQQQQLAIARALVTRPRILILDEPTEGIQPNIVKIIGEAIASLKGRVSVLLVEQYLDFTLEVADRLAVLSRGQVIKQGARADMTRELLSRHITV